MTETKLVIEGKVFIFKRVCPYCKTVLFDTKKIEFCPYCKKKIDKLKIVFEYDNKANKRKPSRNRHSKVSSK